MLVVKSKSGRVFRQDGNTEIEVNLTPAQCSAVKDWLFTNRPGVRADDVHVTGSEAGQLLALLGSLRTAKA